jgi:hypothetical protein
VPVGPGRTLVLVRDSIPVSTAMSHGWPIPRISHIEDGQAPGPRRSKWRIQVRVSARRIEHHLRSSEPVTGCPRGATGRRPVPRSAHRPERRRHTHRPGLGRSHALIPNLMASRDPGCPANANPTAISAACRPGLRRA